MLKDGSMANPDYYLLYSAYVEELKPVSGSNQQYMGKCPFHEDGNPSFAVEMDKGLYYCFAGCGDGNAYQFAERMNLPNPHQYINGSNFTEPPKIEPVTKDLSKEVKPLVENLLKCPDIIPECWDKKIVETLGVGYQNGNFVFSHHDKNGKVIAIQKHKGEIISGAGFSKWYVPHMVKNYDNSKPLYICEGLKDVQSALGIKLNATSVTTGCNSIPKKPDGSFDFDLFQTFTIIIIIYDNDKSGRNGAQKLGSALLAEYPDKTVKIATWDESLPDGYDLTDSLLNLDDMGDMLFKAIDNSVILKPYVPESFGGFNFIRGVDADEMEIKRTFQIIDKLMPRGTQILLGGTTGANKSIMAMQWGMSLANDENTFLGFNINQKGLNVLYCDTECGENILIERYDLLKRNFNWKTSASERFKMLSKDAKLSDIWDDLESAIKYSKPDVLFIDCLYNTTGGIDISKNHNISPITDTITRLKVKYELTIVSIHHMVKGGHESGLQKDRMAGGSALQNWVEHCVLITNTNESYMRLLKIDKSRVISYPTCYFGIEWDADKFWLHNAGIVEDWRKFLIGEDKKVKWKLALESVPDEFTTTDFRNIVECQMKLSKRTAENWLSDMVTCNVIVDAGYGKWVKKLKVIEENELE